MRLRSFLFPAIVSAVSLAAPHMAERPRYGGTLHAEIGASISSLDPAVGAANSSEAGAKEDFLPLAFETLVKLDANGTPQPALASSSEHDVSARHWSFHLRTGVRFHDGTELTPEIAAGAISSLDPSWRISSFSDAVNIETAASAPDLPYLLAESRHAIVRRAENGSLAGTGPFKITTWESGKHAAFAANEDYWAGRPFLDGVDVVMGIAARVRIIDLQLGKVDLVDLPPEMVRRAGDAKLRTTGSVPADLLALVFQKDRAGGSDARVREAVARTIDRMAIVNFILQKQGDAAFGLLPEWLSGTAFLFSSSPDLVGARALWTQIAPAPALVLGYDAKEPLDQAIAERIAVNAREAGITITSRAIADAGSRSSTDAQIVRLRLSSFEPRIALADLLESLTSQSGVQLEPVPNPASAQEIYERERAALDGYRIVPIAHLSRIYGVGSRVRNWEIRPGNALDGWQLGDVWLEKEAQ